MSLQIDVLAPKFYNPDPISGYITVFIEGKQYTIRATDQSFPRAVEAYKTNDMEALLNIMSPALMIQKLYAKYENIEVKDGNVFVYGEPITSVVATRILTFLAEGIDCVPIFKFITRLQNNPSKRAVDELYTFLEHKNLPVTSTGTFVAYKALRNDYTDKHTGRFNNSVGNVLEMPRNRVDDNKEVGCSYGFHAGTLEYASGFASGNDKMVLVEIDPADVVSIPTDCEFQKLRTCKYKVIAEYERPLTEAVYPSQFDTDYDDDVDREWDDDEEESWSDCGNCKCGDCACCDNCCDCKQDSDMGGCMGDPDEPKTEIQLELNLDNKMTEHWLDVRFEYLKLLSWLYAHQRPAVANALRRFFSDVDDQNMIQPQYRVLKHFTSEDDIYKIYQEYTS
jgi:hypothetical protein